MKNNTIENITEYAKNATDIEEPSEYATGVKVGWTAPAKWWNWLMNAFSKRLGEIYETVKSMHEEIKNAVGGTLDENSDTQLKGEFSKCVTSVNDILPDSDRKVNLQAANIPMDYIKSRKAAVAIPRSWNTPAVLSDGTLVVGSTNSNNGIIYSTDKGVTWTASSQAKGSWNTPAVLSSSILVAGSSSSGGIIYSTDKGVTWTQSSQTTGNWHAPAVLSDGTLFICGDGALFSTDNGATWPKSLFAGGNWNTPVILSDGTLIVTNGNRATDSILVITKEHSNLYNKTSAVVNPLLTVQSVGQLPGTIYNIQEGQYALILDTKKIVKAEYTDGMLSWKLVSEL